MVVSRRSRTVIGWGAVAAALGVGVLVALQTRQVFVGLVVYTALAVPIAFVTLYLLFTSRTRTLKLSASGAETYVEGKLKETVRIREIYGPAIGRHRDDSEDLLLEKKNGQNIVLATRISVADAKWATHEIRKYLTSVRP